MGFLIPMSLWGERRNNWVPTLSTSDSARTDFSISLEKKEAKSFFFAFSYIFEPFVSFTSGRETKNFHHILQSVRKKTDLKVTRPKIRKFTDLNFVFHTLCGVTRKAETKIQNLYLGYVWE